MTVKPIILNSWKILREHGDFTEIHKKGLESNEKLSRRTISKLFKTGKCSENTFEIISKFYNEKQAKQDKIQKKAKTILEDDGN